jgi:hypothetical protein
MCLIAPEHRVRRRGRKEVREEGEEVDEKGEEEEALNKVFSKQKQ